MADDTFGGRPPREDIDETFPARLVEPLGPALLGTMRHIAPLLVSAELLDRVVRRGGTRIRPSELHEAMEILRRAVSEDVQAHCRDEAQRIAEWIEHPAAPAPTPGPGDDLSLMHEADIRSRISVAHWAMANELDLELEWYHEETKTWPRGRGTPLRLETVEGDECLVIRTPIGEVTIPVVNLRWLMPVEPREAHVAPQARVLQFPGPGPREPGPREPGPREEE